MLLIELNGLTRVAQSGVAISEIAEGGDFRLTVSGKPRGFGLRFEATDALARGGTERTGINPPRVPASQEGGRPPCQLAPRASRTPPPDAPARGRRAPDRPGRSPRLSGTTRSEERRGGKECRYR